MGELVFGLVLLAVAFFLRLGAATVRGESAAGRPISGTLRILSYVALAVGVITVVGSTAVVINAGEVGVRHAFGNVDPKPLLPGSAVREAIGVTVHHGTTRPGAVPGR